MSIAQLMRTEIAAYPQGKVFTNSYFLAKAKRANVDKVLSRLVETGAIMRIAQGVFVKPEVNRYVGVVTPDLMSVVKTIAESNHETVQIHGAEAVRQLKLSTQMPMQVVLLTNGTSREIKIANQTVKFIHTSNQKKLQHAGTKVGVALSALWYLGKKNVTTAAITKVVSQLTEKEFDTLCSSQLPGWLLEIMQLYKKEITCE